MELNNMFVFFRHNNERTKADSFDRVVGTYKNISLITDSPFYRTFNKMLKIANHVNYDYFLSIDADVILFNYDEIEKSVASGVDYMDFLVLDKFRGVVPAGVHLYSKKMIGLMFSNFNKNSMSVEDIKRPESNTVRKCCDKYGIPFLRNKIPVGIHDFMQYRSDIFYKYVYRGWREPTTKTEEWFTTWDNHPTDIDFTAAKSGILHSHTLDIKKVESGLPKNAVMPEFESLALQEKEREISKEELEKCQSLYYSLLSKGNG